MKGGVRDNFKLQARKKTGMNFNHLVLYRMKTWKILSLTEGVRRRKILIFEKYPGLVELKDILIFGVIYT